MFRWIDYEQNSALFVEGMNTSVALLRHKDFQLHESVTGCKFKMKSYCLVEAKMEAEDFLQNYWKNIYEKLEKILAAKA